MQREHPDARVDELGQKGFTLIELMVVVLIISILIAISVPMFLGARTRANDRATQSDLRNGLTAEKVVYTDTQQYYVNSASVQAAEPSLKWGTRLLVQVGTNLSTDDTVCLSEKSASGTWYSVGDVSATTPSAGAGTYFAQGAADPCTTNAATIASWQLKW